MSTGPSPVTLPIRRVTSIGGSVAEPVRLPAKKNVVARGDWLDFSYALTKMLRHTGGQWPHRA
eukprot:10060696-Heterocapsa_arctica.AAC.1